MIVTPLDTSRHQGLEGMRPIPHTMVTPLDTSMHQGLDGIRPILQHSGYSEVTTVTTIRVR